MAEDPIQLFATRAERYPQPDDNDRARTAIEKIAEQVPILGPATVHVLSQFLMPAYQRRQEEWFKDLADGLDEAERKIEGFSVKNLVQDEVFVSAVIEATRSAVSTHKDEKRDALRNGLLNIALHRSTDEDKQQTFLRYIDELTVWHIRILVLFQNPPQYLAAKGLGTNYYMGSASQVLEDVYPELRGKRELYDQIAGDLNARGLVAGASFLHGMMTAQGMVSKRTTPLGDEFLAFIADPLA